MICATSIMVFGVALYLYFAHGLPSIETLKNYKPSTITKFYSEDGEIISELFIERREVISLERIPNPFNPSLYLRRRRQIFSS